MRMDVLNIESHHRWISGFYAASAKLPILHSSRAFGRSLEQEVLQWTQAH